MKIPIEEGEWCEKQWTAAVWVALTCMILEQPSSSGRRQVYKSIFKIVKLSRVRPESNGHLHRQSEFLNEMRERKGMAANDAGVQVGP